MKILLVNTLYYPYRTGGAEISVQMLAEGLVKSGNNVTVVCLHEHNEIKKSNIGGVTIIYMPLLNLYWPFSGVKVSKYEKLMWHIKDNYNFDMKRIFNDILKEVKPDIVHTHNLTGFSVSIWDVVNKKYPLVHTSRDYYLFNPNTTLFKNNKQQNPNNIFGKIISSVKKNRSKKVDCYIGISKFIKNKHTENGFFNKTILNEVIYNPVSVEKKKNISQIKNVGFIGKVMAEKGFDIFCEVMQKNKDKYNFYVAGLPANNKDSHELYERAKTLGAVMLGHTDFENFIEKVDSVVLPTKWEEPFGRVVVECAMAGLKVYTTPVGGISEIIPRFKNIEILPSSLLLDSYFDHHHKCIESREFSEEICVNKHVEIYGKLLSVFKD